MAEEDITHVIEEMIYLPPNKEADWFVKDQYKERIVKYWKHNTTIYITGMYKNLP